MTLLTQLEELAKKATPGPWQHHCSHVYGPDPNRALVGQFRNDPWLTSDRDLIVALRNSLPSILSALKAVEWRTIETLTEADGEVLGWSDDCGIGIILSKLDGTWASHWRPLGPLPENGHD